MHTLLSLVMEIRKKKSESMRRTTAFRIVGWVDDPMIYVELFDVACLLSRWEALDWHCLSI